MHKKLRKIMNLKPDERELALRKLAQELGCSLTSSYTSDGVHVEEEIIGRIHEAARGIRETRMWWIAVLSAFASVLSALAAWLAVWKN
jgi:hypothetical protein